MVFRFHFGFGIMHTPNELYSHSLRCKPHGCEFLHHQKTLVMAYRCLYEGNILLFSFYIIMFYTARCSFFLFLSNPLSLNRGCCRLRSRRTALRESRTPRALRCTLRTGTSCFANYVPCWAKKRKFPNASARKASCTSWGWNSYSIAAREKDAVYGTFRVHDLIQAVDPTQADNMSDATLAFEA